MKSRFHELASTELDEAIAYYHSKSEGLGDHLLAEVQSAVAYIEQYPDGLDVNHSSDEDRFVIIGKSERARLLVVAFTLRDHTVIRIISAREARRQEREEHEKQLDSR